MTGVRAEDGKSMLTMAPVEDASEEIQDLLRYGRIARLEDWLLINLELGRRGPFLAGTIYGSEHVERNGKPGICTARLILFRPDLGYAVTKNTIYVLGKKKQEGS